MGYDGRVTRFSRIVCSAALALAVGAVPLVADWCAAVCESAHESGPTDAPACHHSASTTMHIGEVPTPCSHDHRPVVVDAAITFAVDSRTATAIPFVTILSSDLSATRVTVDDGSVSGPTSPPLPLTLASILRI